jgi:GAF domain-containing protein
MRCPVIPDNETKRLSALYSLGLLDTPTEQRFDYITEKAKQYFDVAYALITLVDLDRQWFKSSQGLATAETSRDISFCGHAINYSDVFYVPDALQDERFFDNPLVTGETGIRFYAGLAIHTKDGYAIGTLCIIDEKPRIMSDSDFTMLRELVVLVENEIQQ